MFEYGLIYLHSTVINYNWLLYFLCMFIYDNQTTTNEHNIRTTNKHAFAFVLLIKRFSKILSSNRFKSAHQVILIKSRYKVLRSIWYKSWFLITFAYRQELTRNSTLILPRWRSSYRLPVFHVVMFMIVPGNR